MRGGPRESLPEVVVAGFEVASGVEEGLAGVEAGVAEVEEPRAAVDVKEEAVGAGLARADWGWGK
jgi:hypothetical protein